MSGANPSFSRNSIATFERLDIRSAQFDIERTKIVSHLIESSRTDNRELLSCVSQARAN